MLALTRSQAERAGLVKPHKYHAQATVIDGVRFDSKAEAAHYCQLLLRQKQGDIRGLEIHPRFPLHAHGGQRIGEYVADFAYYENCVENYALMHVVDVKGMITPLSKWKMKHFEMQYGIKVEIVR